MNEELIETIKGLAHLTMQASRIQPNPIDEAMFKGMATAYANVLSLIGEDV